jgi:predicted nucleic acid-binding protein
LSNNIEATFLDANVIANWIIVSSGLKEKGDISVEETNVLLNKLSTPVRKSFRLLEKIQNESIPKNVLFTSNIVVAETFSVIGNEYRCRILRKDGIPIRYWFNMMHVVDLSKEYKLQIQEEINELFRLFFRNKKISRKSDFNLNDVANLVISYKCNSHDAMIMAQAIKQNCKYFITEDQRLIAKLKKSRKYKMKLLPSDKYLRNVFE